MLQFELEGRKYNLKKNLIILLYNIGTLITYLEMKVNARRLEEHKVGKQRM